MSKLGVSVPSTRTKYLVQPLSVRLVLSCFDSSSTMQQLLSEFERDGGGAAPVGRDIIAQFSCPLHL